MPADPQTTITPPALSGAVDQVVTSAEPPIQYTKSAAPSGCAIVERIGRDDAGRMIALLVFPNGPPDLPLGVVWEAQPVRLLIDGAGP